jgi:protein phosphatase
MRLIASGNTDIGQKRKSNQDSFHIDMDSKFFVVADGMGGHNGGDVASQMATELLPQYINKNITMDPINLLKVSLKETNKNIKQYGENNPELIGMGTTVVSLFFKDQNLYVANVGDSRAYLINQKKIYQLTRDHSLVQEKLNHGLYTREKAALDPQKNMLVRTVGFEDKIEVDVFVYKICPNDIFLTCSDGLHGKVSDEDILFLINKFIPNPEKADQKMADKLISALIELGNENGGQDNITAITVIVQ